jgi:hypothetical protein
MEGMDKTNAASPAPGTDIANDFFGNALYLAISDRLVAIRKVLPHLHRAATTWTCLDCTKNCAPVSAILK